MKSAGSNQKRSSGRLNPRFNIMECLFLAPTRVTETSHLDVLSENRAFIRRRDCDKERQMNQIFNEVWIRKTN